jgi:hypothetical protein
MIEVSGDLWKLVPEVEEAWPCLKLVTINGECRRSDGAAVMGRGCARQAKDVVPGVDHKLGGLLAEHGNRVMRLASLPDGSHLGSFPVKHGWREEADLTLIERSAYQLVELMNRFGYQTVFLPRPGAGIGKRSYQAEIKPLIEEILVGGRFVIVTY